MDVEAVLGQYKVSSVVGPPLPVHQCTADGKPAFHFFVAPALVATLATPDIAWLDAACANGVPSTSCVDVVKGHSTIGGALGRGLAAPLVNVRLGTSLVQPYVPAVE